MPPAGTVALAGIASIAAIDLFGHVIGQAELISVFAQAPGVVALLVAIQFFAKYIGRRDEQLDDLIRQAFDEMERNREVIAANTQAAIASEHTLRRIESKLDHLENAK